MIPLDAALALALAAFTLGACLGRAYGWREAAGKETRK